MTGTRDKVLQYLKSNQTQLKPRAAKAINYELNEAATLARGDQDTKFSDPNSAYYHQFIKLASLGNNFRNVDLIVYGLHIARRSIIEAGEQVSDEHGVALARAAHKLWQFVEKKGSLSKEDYQELISGLEKGEKYIELKKSGVKQDSHALETEHVKSDAKKIWAAICLSHNKDKALKLRPEYFDVQTYEAFVEKELWIAQQARTDEVAHIDDDVPLRKEKAGSATSALKRIENALAERVPMEQADFQRALDTKQAAREVYGDYTDLLNASKKCIGEMAATAGYDLSNGRRKS